ncbi:hypothetical protein BC831DRAFT_512942 [Entophlyctis helioformis]|nr:hypothetical protein BC831DRAFT_512942 [Entophlyctis helioformis]
MESTLDLVAAHCGLQVKLYGACVERNPHNWESVCKGEKTALTKCAEENVGELRRVKERCAPFIASYRSCLEDNKTDPQACMSSLRELYNCHQSVAAELQGQSAAAASSSPSAQ